ncbi:hypothetical protein CI238_10319, partial [Colletotrichum incanum]
LSRKKKHVDSMAMPSFAVKWLLEASLDTLVVGRKRSAGVRTIQAMESPPLVRLVPEVFNIKYLSNIEPGRMQPLIEDRAESQPSEARSHSSKNIWQQLWRLTRTRLPPFQKGDLQPRAFRKAAAIDNGIFLVQEAERSTGYQSAPDARSFAYKGPNHEVGSETGVCESYIIQDHLSGSEMGEHEGGENVLVSEAVDDYQYSCPPLAVNGIAFQYEDEVDDNEACYVEVSVDYNEELDSLNSGEASLLLAPFLREASLDCLEVKGLYRTDPLEDRRLSQNSTPVSFSTEPQAIAAHACEPFDNWWSSDVASGDDQSVTHDSTSKLQESILASPQSECHKNRIGDEDGFQESLFEAGSGVESCAHNDEGLFEGSDDAYWEPASQAHLSSTAFLQDIEMEGNFDDE